jgi:hypothetical protein
VTLAAHSTFVSPNATNTDPAGYFWKPRVIVTGRSSSSVLPSARVTASD